MADNKSLTLSREEMRTAGEDVLDLVIDHFLHNHERSVTKPTDPAMLARWLQEPIPETGMDLGEVIEEFKEKALNTMTHLDHPRCFAFVPSPNNFVSALAEFMSSSFNIFAGAWLGPSGVAAIEMKSIDWLKTLIGLPKDSGGLFVSGGSMANLTALAVARHIKLQNNPTNAAVYFSDQTHSSVPKGLKILGFQPYQIRSIASDVHMRLPLESLAQRIDEDRKRGLVPFCVIANAGTTNAGAIDPLEDLVEFCKEQGLWLHVDGAYGGATAITQTGKTLLKGIEKADSITIDPHKWMFQPYEIGCLLVRDTHHLKEAFKVTAEYLDVLEDNGEQTNFCDHGVQLTRGFRALKFWMSLKTFGLKNFRDAVDQGINNAEYVQSLLERDPRWEIITDANIGVINFRFNPGYALSPGFHNQLSRDIILDGFAMITPTRIKDMEVLRICAINPRTTQQDFELTINKLTAMAEERLPAKLTA
ncbi:pyridoxal phosphate-dependent decarboxylase family protein [Robiginitomaculum antarcticum]|uniref:pyridoxal phosphate-dependent decarboxylase family protein n=1 Tax=Robiginitomaculum antarcticum TaxID=437507 RepID=UPI0003AB0FB4|nr:aminotransferase class I/II-fold pyridoxal phosphate-dependent enzyme [Robiginitomaculum antarcticum]